jgi:hypothetical protein
VGMVFLRLNCTYGGLYLLSTPANMESMNTRKVCRKVARDSIGLIQGVCFPTVSIGKAVAIFGGLLPCTEFHCFHYMEET